MGTTFPDDIREVRGSGGDHPCECLGTTPSLGRGRRSVRHSACGRLIGFFEEHRDHARLGLLPTRAHGYPLTRFMGDHEWGPDGNELQASAYDLQEIWPNGH
jgi:hypothetical protein